MAGWWIIGAAMTLIGSIMINFGTNMMKLGHNKRAEAEARGEEIKGKSKEWLIGVIFFSVGNVLNFVSFGFAAQSLLAGTSSFRFAVLISVLPLDLEASTYLSCAPCLHRYP